jgi:serine/threonine-protein kinase RsbW
VKTRQATIASTWNAIGGVPEMLAELVGSDDVSESAVADMSVALDEILSNIVKYAYSDGRVHFIDVRLTLSDEALVAEVSDDGRPFDPLSIGPPEQTGPLSARRVGGLGIHFVRNLMSEVTYARVMDRNRVVLTKRLDPDR